MIMRRGRNPAHGLGASCREFCVPFIVISAECEPGGRTLGTTRKYSTCPRTTATAHRAASYTVSVTLGANTEQAAMIPSRLTIIPLTGIMDALHRS